MATSSWQHGGMAARNRKPITERRDRDAFEERRLQAAQLFQEGIHQAEVARRFGVSRQTASRWHAAGATTAPPACAASANRAAPPSSHQPSLSGSSGNCCKAPRPRALPPR